MALIPIEIVYADDKNQFIIPLSVPDGCCIEKAIHASGILTRFPTIDLAKNKVGIFAKIYPLTTVVHAGDRIEIYRPLTTDPKQTRVVRAQKQRANLAKNFP
jgi:uncharacterized protein